MLHVEVCDFLVDVTDVSILRRLAKESLQSALEDLHLHGLRTETRGVFLKKSYRSHRNTTEVSSLTKPIISKHSSSTWFSTGLKMVCLMKPLVWRTATSHRSTFLHLTTALPAADSGCFYI